MAQITVTGVIKDFDGDFPTSGTVTFSQSGMFIDTSGAIIPATSETANVSAVDGSFSMTLSSTLDGIPSNITYSVVFNGVIEGATVSQVLGSIQLAASPSSVLLKDLLIAGIGGGTAVTPTIAAADVSLTLKETDQSLPAGMWRLRVQGDVLTLEKNTAVAGDFSTLTEILRSTATLFTLDIDQRISSAAPRLQWYETDQAADEKLWDIISASKVLTFRTRTDADGAGVTWLQVTRGTGTAVSASEFPGALRALRLGIGAASDGVSAIYIAAAGATANQYALRVIGNATTGQSYGATIAAGTNSSDAALSVYAQNESTLYFRVRGDGVTIPGQDATYDFGGSGNRWKSGFFGTNVAIGSGGIGYAVDVLKSSASAASGTYPGFRISNSSTATHSLSDIQIIGNNGSVSFGILVDGLATVYGTGAFLITNTNHPINFHTNNTARAKIPAAGGFVIGTAALATTATDGFLYMPTCAGAPTGVPSTQTGTVAHIYDTTNNKLYIYNGAWKSVTLT